MGMVAQAIPDGAGWFSECVQYPDFDVTTNGVTLDPNMTESQVFTHACQERLSVYLTTQLPFEPFYSPCLCQGLWLHVLEHWRRRQYLVRS
jgi:hypothetical protein